jgi:hypothetical protein
MFRLIVLFIPFLGRRSSNQMTARFVGIKLLGINVFAIRKLKGMIKALAIYSILCFICSKSIYTGVYNVNQSLNLGLFLCNDDGA